MNRHRRVIAGLAVAAGLAGFGGTATAAADTPDEAFAKAVTSLGIAFAPSVDLPAVGAQVCDLLTTGLKGNVNPVPTVRGVVSTLQSNGMTRAQAEGLMKASVAVYCPQHARIIGR